MNGGLDDWCGAIAIAPDGSVFLGGGFQIAGNIEAKHIARWTPAWVGREQLKEGEVRLRIHPQPASDELYIETASLFRPGEEITLSVYASDGQLLLSEEDIAGKRQHLNISRLHPGIYILQLTGSLRSVMQIIMKE